MKSGQRNRRLIALLAIGSGLLKSFPALVMFNSLNDVDSIGDPTVLFLITAAAILLIAGGLLLFFEKHSVGFVLILIACSIRILSGLNQPPTLDLFIDLLLAICSVYYLVNKKSERIRNST